MRKSTSKLIHGDCVEIMKTMGENSIDSIVCDPPYGISMSMGRGWDKTTPAHEWAKECFRVVKPGAHLIAFGANRTLHRLATTLENAGFEIRDQIGWVTWSTFPKSMNIGKALEKRGLKNQFNGWGTQLKSCIEPAILARKPFSGTLIDNVIKWGTGGLNIDSCRMLHDDPMWIGPSKPVGNYPNGCGGGFFFDGANPENDQESREAPWNPNTQGRWPPNLIYAPKVSRKERELGCDSLPSIEGWRMTNRKEGTAGLNSPRAGAGRTQRGLKNHHPTLKPIALMRWLCRLVTPPGGIMLDTYTGSGSAMMAAVLEGFDCVGCELEEEYIPIAKARIQWAHEEYFRQNRQLGLWGAK